MFDEKMGSNMDSASVFYKCSTDAVYVADECLQIHGGNGYINEYMCG
jgi:alkylation response protein AidB-like acyl-CoA dehydrogenase